MEQQRINRLHVMHDLALLYLALAHGADRRLAREELHSMAVRLRNWIPESDPKLIDHIIREASMSYENGFSEEDLKVVVGKLTDQLDAKLRRKVLEDLMSIASSDNVVRPAESAFVRELAGVWQLDPTQVFYS